MNRLVLPIAVTVLNLGSITATEAQEGAVNAGGEETITISGFVSASLWAQNGRFGFGDGQAATWVERDFEENPWFSGGDVRNTRIAVAFDGPELFGEWSAGGAVELDFFGGFDDPGSLAGEGADPRLHLAYADLSNGRTTLRVGQMWAPVFGYVPASLSHLAVPLGYGGTGLIGWRFPGVFLYHNLRDADAPTTAQLQLAAMRGSWDGDATFGGVDAGAAALMPQLEARLDLNGLTPGGIEWGAYAAAHWDRKDLSGAGQEGTGFEDDDLTGRAVSLGARLVPGSFTLQANAYVGTAVGQQLGELAQFGDLSGRGAWAQAGYALTAGLSVWGFYGIGDPHDDDLLEQPRPVSVRTRNQQSAAMLRYAVGPYALGVEWLGVTTDWRVVADDVIFNADRTAQQIAVSMFYAF